MVRNQSIFTINSPHGLSAAEPFISSVQCDTSRETCCKIPLINNIHLSESLQIKRCLRKETLFDLPPPPHSSEQRWTGGLSWPSVHIHPLLRSSIKPDRRTVCSFPLSAAGRPVGGGGEEVLFDFVSSPPSSPHHVCDVMCDWPRPAPQHRV